MTDLELLIIGAMVSFIAVAGAYIAMRHRANETPVESYARSQDAERNRTVIRPQNHSR